MGKNIDRAVLNAMDEANRRQHRRNSYGAVVGLGLILAVAGGLVLAIWLKGTW